jgi:hypothetical protein
VIALSEITRIQYGLTIVLKKPTVAGGAFKICFGGITNDKSSGKQIFALYDVVPSTGAWTLTAALEQTNMYGLFSLGDNLNNNDFIYTMLVKRSSINLMNWEGIEFYVAVLKVSVFESLYSNPANRPLNEDFSGDTTLSAKVPTGNTVYRLYNLGTMNYLFGVPYGEGKPLKIWSKTFATFGQDSKSVYLPSSSPVTSATYAYGFFRYRASGSFNFYYQGDQSNGPIYKSRAVLCDFPSQDYFNTTSRQCIFRPSTSPSGYRLDDSKNLIEQCTTNNCDTCPTSAATCTKCKSGFTLVGNACVECSVTNCLACSAANVCASCAAPFSGANCSAVQCDVNECSLCVSANVCLTCQNGQSTLRRRQTVLSARQLLQTGQSPSATPARTTSCATLATRITVYQMTIKPVYLKHAPSLTVRNVIPTISAQSASRVSS